MVSFSSIFNSDEFEHTCFRIHCRIPKLCGIHFTKTFVALQGDRVFTLRGITIFLDESIFFAIVVAILFRLTLAAAIEWWHRNVKVVFANNLWEVAIEKRHNQRCNVLTIDVSIRHNHDFVVAKFVDVRFLRIHFSGFSLLLDTKTDAECLNDVVHLIALESFVPHCLLHVEDFTAERKNSLCRTTATLFCRTTCRVTLDKEKFAFLRHLARAVRKFSRKTATAHRIFALHRFASLASRHTCSSSKNHFVHNQFRFLRVFLQIVGECFTHGLVHSTHHLAIAEFCFGLSFKLRFSYLHANHRRETFAEVLTCDFDFRLLNLLLRRFFRILFQHTRHRRAETREVSTTFDGVDVVDVRMKVFRIACVVNNRNFHGDTLFFRVDVNHIRDERSAHCVLVTHKFAQTLFGVESFRKRLAVFVYFSLIGENDGESRVEESQFAHTIG